MLKLSTPSFGIILPFLPSRSCRVTSGLVSKAYQTAGQVVLSMYMMAVLQAYLGPISVTELLRDHRLVSPCCQANSPCQRPFHSMVTKERHLWLNLLKIKERETVFLLDTQISSSGLFGNMVNVVVNNF